MDKLSPEEIEFQKQQDEYLSKMDKRIEDVKSSQTIDFQYEIRLGDMNVTLELPKRVMDQKRLLRQWIEWRDHPEVPANEDVFYSSAAQYIFVDDKRLNLDATDLECGQIDALMMVYGDFMMRPFFLRTTMKTNSHLSSL